MVTFVGTNGDDTLDADTGTITGFTGGTLAELQDLIGDTIEGGLNFDYVFAGNGDDEIYAMSAASPDGSGVGDILKGAGGADTIRGANGVDTMYGGDGDDILTGGDSTDELVGEAGNDTFTMTAGHLVDNIDGGTGTDGLDLQNFASEAATVDLAGGTYDVAGFGSGTIASVESVKGGGGADTILGASANEDLKGGGGADLIWSEGGDDTVKGGGGADDLKGGGGIDTLDYTNSAAVNINLNTNSASGGDAAGDTINGFENINGSSNDDTLTGTTGISNYLLGNDGADVIDGLSGNDTIRGGAGADNMTGGTDSDTLDYTGSAAVSVNLGTNAVSGGDAAGDTITGFESVIGTSNADTLTGAGDANTFTGAGGADIMDGAGGVDMANYSDATGAVTVNLNSGTGTGDVAQGDVLSNIENVNGGDFNDVLTGAHGVDNWLGGGFGNDNLNGFSGNDTIVGGSGNDTLTGNFGVDNLDGGDGTDMANYSDATARVVVRLWNGTGEGNLAQGDVLTNIENLNGSNFNDILFGADGVANWLGGGNGPDYLNGLSGNDTLVGGAGNDSLAGGSGADRHDFSAGSGADRVFNMITGAGVWDVIRITGYGAALDSFAEILAATTQVGADAVINLGGGNTITLVGTLKTSLVADDFTFV